jgi:uncharacterized protein (DUF362 family)
MISRRKFVKIAGVYFLSGPFFSGKVYPAGTADIGVVKGTDVDAAVRMAVSAIGGINAFVKRGDIVIIKPNLSFASPPERATTTSPEVIKAIMKLCLDAGAKKVMVVDNPLQDAKVIQTKSLLAQVVEETNNAMLLLPTTENLYEETPIPKGKELKKTQLLKILNDADVLINVPIAKSHSATGVSLGIKGNMGLIWDRIALHNSSDLNQSIADLATVIKPNLTIVDARRALTTRGPQGPGKVVQLDTIVAGRDPVAVDSYTVSLTPWYNKEFTGSMVKHLLYANEMGIGKVDTSTLTITKQIL